MPTFLAKRDFANNLEPRLVIENAIHERHVHKGATVVIGDPKMPFDSLPERSPLRQLIGALAAADCLIEADDDKAVKRLRIEIAADEARKKADKELESRALAFAGKK